MDGFKNQAQNAKKQSGKLRKQIKRNIDQAIELYRKRNFKVAKQLLTEVLKIDSNNSFAIGLIATIEKGINIPNEVSVETLGGSLVVKWEKINNVYSNIYLSGSVSLVFQGYIEYEN